MGLNKTVLARIIGSIGSAAPVTRMVSTRGDIAISRLQATLANRTCIEGRTKHTITDDVESIRVVFGGYYCTDTEAAIGNDQTIQIAMEIPAGQGAIGGPTAAPYVIQGTFSASATGTIVDGAAEYISDPINASSFGIAKFPRGLTFWLRQRRTVPLNGYWPTYPNNPVGISGEGSYYSDGLQTSQLVATGAMTTPTGGAAAGYSFLPLAIIGDVAGGNISVLGIGDSIMYYSNDVFSDGSAGGGWFARGLYNNSALSRTIAWGRVARGTSKAYTYIGAGGSEKRSAIYKYYSHAVIHYGTNDGAAGQTAAQTRTALRSIAAACKAAGVKHVLASLILPRCATTDSGATVANQTPISGFATGGAFRDTLNAAIAADVGSYFDGMLDLASVVADTTFPDRWKAGYSTDTIHPSTGSPSAAMGSAWAAVAGALSAG